MITKGDVIKETKLLTENKELKKWLKALEEKQKKLDGLVQRGINSMEIESLASLEKPFDGLIGKKNA